MKIVQVSVTIVVVAKRKHVGRGESKAGGMEEIMTVLEKVQDIVKAASDKTSEVIEVSKLRAGIAEEKRAISEQEAKLGAIYYDLYKAGDVLTPDAVNICMVIDKYVARLEEKEAQIKKINEANAAKRAAKSVVPASDDAVCPECGSANPAGSKFCSECGAKIPEIIDAEAVEVEEPAEPVKQYCTKCGAEIVPGKKFCNECGEKVETAEPVEESKVEE